MPSSIQFASPSTSKPRSSSIYSRPPKKQKMSITQTYSLAHSARGKLSKAASRADHNLRVLVGHANLLDSVMLDLANAEREQGQWFNKVISQSEEVFEDPEEDWQAEDAEDSASDSASDSDSDSAEFENIKTSSRAEPTITVVETNDEDQFQQQDIEVDDDEEEDYDDLALTRTASRHEYPPDLSFNSDSDSEDEDMPPSPPSHMSDAFTDAQKQSLAEPSKATSLSESQQKAFIEEGYFLAPRNQRSTDSRPTMIAAF